MKIGIVGYGYWGQIIYNNLRLMGYTNIVVCDPFSKIEIIDGDKAYINKTCDNLYQCEYVFVATPPNTHFELCRDLLKRKINVWCEKPPTLGLDSTKHLYDLAEQNDCKFFVDWTLLFNDLVLYLAEFIDNHGMPCSIFMNRMNYGPIRQDTTAKYDLACHDISMLLYLCPSTINNIVWYEYDLCQLERDTCIGIIEANDYIAQLNASWSVNTKIRTCYFNFEDTTAIFDDCKKILTIDNITRRSISSPLANAINTFLHNDTKYITSDKLQQITLDTMEILHGSTIQ